MDSLEYLNGKELDIYAYTVMPNHVHAVFNVIDDEKPLFRIM
jgi:REP element-mobilizing transposase RayT